jgi:cold shock CspA family protein
MANEQYEGTVISYNPLKGFGWVAKGETPAEFEKLFYHVKDWRGDDLPKRGLKVTFQVQDWLDGPQRRALEISPR